MDEREQLRQAIALQEQMRGLVPDAVIDTAVLTLKEKLAALETTGVPENQRKQVAILFADVAGFTALSETLDPEDAQALINQLWGAVDAAIVAHGGYIDKHIGDAVMALWGVEQAQEDDVEQAVRAGLAMQTAVAQFCAARDVPLAMRIGVNSGLALLGQVGASGEFTAMGDAVNIAARLEQAAPPGGILISRDAYRQVRGLFNLAPQPPLTAKGKSEPLQTYLVRGLRPRAFRLGNRGVEGLETEMIGRAVEFEQIKATLRLVLDKGVARLITIVGEAGLGKSRLLFEFDKWLDAEVNVALFKGRADYQRQGMPFALARDLFYFRCQILDSDSSATALTKLEAEFVKSLGEESGRPAAHFIAHLLGLDMSRSPFVGGILSDARQIRERAFGYAVAYFQALAAETPVALLLEDIHWGDSSSLDLLSRLGRDCAHIPLIVVANGRPSLFERRADWGAGWQNPLRLDLQPLSPEESRTLIAHILRKIPDLPPSLAETIAASAEGNPFYVEELIKMLIDQGVIVSGAERWRVVANELPRLRIPPTLTGILQARLDRLASAERQALQRAAVVGRIFWDEAVAYLAELNEEEEIAAERSRLGGLQSKELVFRRGESAFAGAAEYIMKHAILHEVTYETVLKKYRPAYHRRAAEWLARQPQADAYAALIAKHYERAGDEAEMARWYIQAGQMAFKNYAPAEGKAYFESALSATTLSNADKVNAYYHIAVTARFQAQLEVAQEVVDRALELAKKTGLEDQVKILQQLAALYTDKGQYRQALDELVRADALLQQLDPPPAKLQVSIWDDIGWIHFNLDNFETVADYAQKAITVSQRENLTQQLARVRNLMGVTYYARMEYAQALEWWQKAILTSRQLGDLFLEAQLLNNVGETLMTLGEFRESVFYAEQAASRFREMGINHYETYCLLNLNKARLLLREFELAGQSVQQILSGLDPNAHALRIFAHSIQLQLQTNREDKQGAQNSAAYLWEMLPQIETPSEAASVWQLIGTAVAAIGEIKLDGLAELSAESCFQKSATIFESKGMKHDKAQTLFAWASYLYKSGQIAAAESRYREARAIFVELNLSLWVARLDEEWTAQIG